MRRLSFLALAFPLVACGRHAASPTAAYPSTAESSSSGSGGGASVERMVLDAAVPAADPTAPQAPAPQSAPDSGVASGAIERADGPADAGAPVAVREMFDIEAHIDILVASPVRAARQVRDLCRRYQGMVTEEAVRVGPGGATANLTLRVKVTESNQLFDALRGIGEVTSQVVKSHDIGKAYFDAQVLLANLEAALQRYQRLLDKANTVADALQIEAQLDRIRREMERVKGDLRWMNDRAARATVYLTLNEQPRPEVASDPPAPVAMFYPGVRGGYLLDLRGEDGDHGYAGAGLSLRKGRGVFELDGFKRLRNGARGLDALIVTVGGDSYSQLLGGGRRRTFNPYLGLRIGYARLPAKEDAFVLGASVGLELFKSSTVLVDLSARALGFLSSELHVGITPTLGVNLAF